MALGQMRKLSGEAVTANDALIEGGLDWIVATQAVYYRNLAGNYVEIRNKRATVRQDTERVLGVVGSGYVPLQNIDGFSLVDSIVGSGDAKYVGAGFFNDGKTTYLQAEIGDPMEPQKGDKIRKLLTLTNSHDGSRALRVFPTPVRVVCENSLAWAIKSAKLMYYGKHTSDLASKATDARNLLELGHVFYANYEKDIMETVEKKMTEVEIELFLKELYGFKLDKEKETLVYLPDEDQDYRSIQAFDATWQALQHPTNTLGGMQGTAYQALNAVTYYTDHIRNIRGGNKTYSEGSESASMSLARTQSSWFGNGRQLRQRAKELLSV